MITGISTTEISENFAENAEQIAMDRKVEKYIEEMLSIKVHAEEVTSEITAPEKSPAELVQAADNTNEVSADEITAIEIQKQKSYAEELHAGKLNAGELDAGELDAGELNSDEQHEEEFHIEGTHNADLAHLPVPVFPSDRGYYIWYKESVPSVTDTSIISDEYELLYQSVKRTEYKSRLNVYVSTYTVCLAIVTIMLITFPFMPGQLNDFHDNSLTAAEYSVDKAIYVKPSEKINKLGENPYFNLNPFVQYVPESNTQVAPQEITKQEQQPEINKPGNNNPKVTTPKENTKVETSSNREVVDGMSRNSLGFTDLKNNVVYIVLPNGKYSIQESSWNNEEKALSRINKLNSLGIKNPKGTILKAQFEKADIVDKGVWYRTRIGEFSSLQEAKQTAEQIRTEEKTKNIASLYIFPGCNLKV